MLELALKRRPDDQLQVLCLGAHCDDIEIGCGGTLLKLQESAPGANFTWAVFSATPARASETEVAANTLFGNQNQFNLITFNHRDGFMPYDGGAVKDDFESLKDRLHPDLVFTHYRRDLHQDHRLICELTWNTFRDHLILEYEIPKYDGDIGRPNTYVPIPHMIAERKLSLLLDSYTSQVGKPWFDRDLFLAAMRLRGMECNAPSGLAEAFYGSKLRLTL